MKLESVC